MFLKTIFLLSTAILCMVVNCQPSLRDLLTKEAYIEYASKRPQTTGCDYYINQAAYLHFNNGGQLVTSYYTVPNKILDASISLLNWQLEDNVLNLSRSEIHLPSQVPVSTVEYGYYRAEAFKKARYNFIKLSYLGKDPSDSEKIVRFFLQRSAYEQEVITKNDQPSLESPWVVYDQHLFVEGQIISSSDYKNPMVYDFSTLSQKKYSTFFLYPLIGSEGSGKNSVSNYASYKENQGQIELKGSSNDGLSIFKISFLSPAKLKLSNADGMAMLADIEMLRYFEF